MDNQTSRDIDSIENHKMKRCHKWGLLLFLIVIIIVLFYLIYCKMSPQKTFIGLDLPQLGLPTTMPDIIVFPDFQL